MLSPFLFFVAACLLVTSYRLQAQWTTNGNNINNTNSGNVGVRTTAPLDRLSSSPGIAPGEQGEGKVLVATIGRVKVRVSAKNGPIEIGNLLVTSDQQGLAIKSEAALPEKSF